MGIPQSGIPQLGITAGEQNKDNNRGPKARGGRAGSRRRRAEQGQQQKEHTLLFVKREVGQVCPSLPPSPPLPSPPLLLLVKRGDKLQSIDNRRLYCLKAWQLREPSRNVPVGIRWRVWDPPFVAASICQAATAHASKCTGCDGACVQVYRLRRYRSAPPDVAEEYWANIISETTDKSRVALAPRLDEETEHEVQSGCFLPSCDSAIEWHAQLLKAMHNC